MIKRNNKKGFTIVELVIVIAVIAILAGVLIPTFAGIVKKANLSADQQAVRQMNIALVAGSAEKTPANIDDVAKILSDAGFNAEDTLVPVSKGHRFYWSATYNTIVLVKGTEVVFPTDNEDLVNGFEAENNSGKCYDLKLGYGKTDVAGIDEFKTAIADGQNVTLKTDTPKEIVLEVPAEAENHPLAGRPAAMVIAADEVVSIDLGGNTLSATSNNVAIVVEGELVLTNGTVASRGITVVAGGKLTIEEGVTVEASAADGGQAIRNIGGVVTINGGTFNALNGDTPTNPDKEPGCIYNSGYMVINGGTFKSQSGSYAVIASGGTTIINGGTFEASRGAVSATGQAYLEINGGTFTSNLKESAYALYYACDTLNATLKITGGTFNNAAGGYDAYIKGGEKIEIATSVLTKVDGTDYNYNSAN